MPSKNILPVPAIKNGTVIDHITAGQALTVIRFLNLADQNKLVTVGLNLPSQRIKVKDLIKVAGWEITAEQANQVALLAAAATVNIIRNYTVEKKFALELPTTIEHLLVCPNPMCITNHEPMDTRFAPSKRQTLVQVKCYYCERTFGLREIKEFRVG